MLNVGAQARYLLGAASLGAVAIVAPSAPAVAQTARRADITVSAMPMDAALRAIGDQAGVRVTFDPDAVKGVTSRPVRGEASLRKAVQEAIRGTGLTVVSSANGELTVVNDIVVVARRDEAETSVLVHQASTSDRNGLSLREQPRNTQVISAKTIEDQQALSISDILRNAGGVSVQANSPGSGAGYTIRGFSAGGLVNGLSGSATFGVASGANQPIANIERVEILKGPDALLSGFDNLGGNVNVVTKKPYGGQLLAVSFDTGSYGLVRGVIDANNAITADKKLSARVVASAQTMDHTYGGYSGSQDYLFAPSIRFKDSRTDILLGASLSKSTTGLTPYTVFDRGKRTIIDRDLSTPIYSRDQQVRVNTARFYIDASRQITPGIEMVVRGLHDDNKLGLDMYPLSYNRQGQLTVAVRGSGQQGQSDAIDAFVRVKGHVGAVKARLNAGYNFNRRYFEPLSSDAYTVIRDIPLGANTSLPVLPRPTVGNPSFRLTSQSQGVYAEMLIEAWKFKLLGGARHEWYQSTFEIPGLDPFPPDRNNATVPNAGIVFDATENVSLFANYLEGSSAVTQTDAKGRPLPNIMTKNKEAGVKVDFFRKHATVNASYFDLQQDNTLINDPQNPGFSLPAPGQRGRGIDLNVVGQILTGWTVQASLTRTKWTPRKTC